MNSEVSALMRYSHRLTNRVEQGIRIPGSVVARSVNKPGRGSLYATLYAAPEILIDLLRVGMFVECGLEFVRVQIKLSGILKHVPLLQAVLVMKQ